MKPPPGKAVLALQRGRLLIVQPGLQLVRLVTDVIHDLFRAVLPDFIESRGEAARTLCADHLIGLFDTLLDLRDDLRNSRLQIAGFIFSVALAGVHLSAERRISLIER